MSKVEIEAQARSRMPSPPATPYAPGSALLLDSPQSLGAGQSDAAE